MTKDVCYKLFHNYKIKNSNKVCCTANDVECISILGLQFMQLKQLFVNGQHIVLKFKNIYIISSFVRSNNML